MMRTTLPLVVLIAIAAAACASANAPEWQVYGPESVGVRELAVDADGKTVYAASDFVYRSVDVGVRWDRTSAPPADVTRVGGALVAADPRVSGTLYTAAHDVWRSTDGGAHWTRVAAYGSDAEGLAVASDGTVYTAFYAVVRRSVDGGATWSVPSARLADTIATALAVDPADPSVLLAGTFEHGGFGSRDGGLTWKPLTGLDGSGLTITTFTFDARSSGTVYAGTRGHGAFRSDDGGRTWHALSPVDEPNDVESLLVDRASGHILAGTFRDGLYRSADNGATWKRAGLGYRGVDALAAMKDGTLLAGTESGVFASADGGTTWTVRRGGMIGPEVRAVLAAPGAPVFAGAWNYDGIVASTDRGRTWSSIPSGLPPGEDVIGLAFGPGTHSEVFAATAFDGLFRSSDGGASWTRAGFARTRMWAVASNRADRSIEVAGDRGIPYRSTDSGATWVADRRGLSVHGFGTFAVSGSTLYGGGGTVWARVRGRWVARRQGLPAGDGVSRLAADPQRPGVLYAAFDVSDTVYGTADAGLHWRRTALPAGTGNLIIAGLVAHDGIVVVGFYGRMLESRDAGRTWHQLGTTLPTQDIWSLGWDGSTLYAATSRGVYTYGG